MKRTVIVWTALAWAVVSGGGRTSAADQLVPQAQNDPGRATQARVYILNRERADAIPVTIQAVASTEPLRVAVAGTPTVTVSGATEVSARAARQNWEYRLAQVPATADPTPALNGLGAEGWELTGPPVALPNGDLRFILKRPR
jgi:hypothetical protein